MPRALAFLWLAPLAVLASCASHDSFDNRWDATTAPMTANPAALMAGKWEGTWQSDSTDYNGHLQSIIVLTGMSIDDRKPVQQYEASLQLRLFEVPFTHYDVKLNATKLADGRIHFEGAKDLGFNNGGIFRYDGYIYPDKDEFFCEYNSDKDTGTFKMRRITLDKQ